MGRPIRCQKKDSIYFLTNRTLHQKFFLRPCEEVNAIVLGLLAKMADRYGIEIFAFVFMSNHFHLLARSKSLQMHLFMRDFQGQLARKLNRHWGRSGHVFERRYTATEILDDAALVDKLRYTVCNPCESDLVRHPKLWPGLSSWSIHKSGEALVGEIVNREVYWSLKQRKEAKGLSEQELIERATEQYPLQMAKLPKFKALEDDAYCEKICELVEDYAAMLAKTRTKPCLGAKKVLSQHYDDRPNNPKKSPRPICHTNCPKMRKEYLEELWQVTDSYRKAVGKLRENKTQVSFPQGTIPPGHLQAVGGGCAEAPGPPPDS
jgi:REP element-mobilizing transposase RayT